jgi:branched-subunit amino acid aminotransferase/4-amino-4-deoxychorismate lyase
LEGVTRAVLLEIGETVGVPMEEEELLPKDLYEADEVFMSSTTRSALAATEVEGKRLPEAPGPVTQRLERAMAEYIAGYVASHAAGTTK